MLFLFLENKMTVKELSTLFNVSVDTVQNVIKELYPNKMQKGKKTNLIKEECIYIGEKIRKKGYIELPKNTESLPNNSYVTKDDLKDFGKSLVQEIFKQIIPIIQNKNQIELKQDYFSLLGYMKYKGIDEARFSEMICYGKEASRISREMNKDIRKVPDERFGTVNSYHILVLEKLFEI